MEAKIATPEETLSASHYLVANFILGEINTECKLENRKKNLSHCNIRYSLNVKNSFVKHAKIKH